MKKFKIVIPSISIDKKLIYCLRGCLKLEHKNFDIIIIVEIDTKIKLLDKFLENNKNVKIYIKNIQNMSAKRNFAVFNNPAAEFVAFIDSDAYPSNNWLKVAENLFENKNYILIGGPSAVPFPNNNYQKRITNFAKKSFFVTGYMSFQKISYKSFETNNIESCNMFIKENIYREINGMDENLYQAEDFSLCKKIKDQNKENKIYFSKDLIVHHMDRNITRFLLQRLSFGLNHLSTLDKIIISKMTIFLTIIPSIYIIFFIIYLIIFGQSLYFFLLNIFFLITLCVLIKIDFIKKELKITGIDLIFTFLMIILAVLSFSFGVLLSFFNFKKLIQKYIYIKSQN